MIMNRGRRTIKALVGLTIVVVALSMPASAQTPTAKIFREQYMQLREQAESFMTRAQDSRQQATRLREEGLAIVKLIHRLQEEAMQANAERNQHGATTDKLLLFIAQACGALDFALAAISNYIDTGDRSFISLARQGFTLAQAVEQYF
jgi:hypothetical protein